MLLAHRRQLKENHQSEKNKFPEVCHPRAGGDPFGWIPVCAGMTDTLLG
jgi:hypothetical protein